MTPPRHSPASAPAGHAADRPRVVDIPDPFPALAAAIRGEDAPKPCRRALDAIDAHRRHAGAIAREPRGDFSLGDHR